jgi:cytochrome P450
MSLLDGLDRTRLRELFDLRSASHAGSVGGFEDDPYPVWHRLREQAPIHPGTLHELTGHHGPIVFQGLPYDDRPHFTAFTFAACDEALRDERRFASSPTAVDFSGEVEPLNSMLSMGGAQHRRYRALVQPAFVPAKAVWWLQNWIDETVHALIDLFVDDGRADLNLDFCAALPVLTITGSFGVPVEQSLAIRSALHNPAELVPLIAPIVAARRGEPGDDLISILTEASIEDDAGERHRLSDGEIYSFAVLLLAAGSGTTWRQMGTALAALLQHPDSLDAVRADPVLLRAAVDESVRWAPTNPMFSRFVTEDLDFHGADLPAGAVLHLGLGAGSRDPDRWDRPDEFDVHRPTKPSLGFGGGPHVCVGMHLARAEMVAGIGALLERLPNLRLDPDAPPPKIIGMYHRGPTALPVRFG